MNTTSVVLMHRALEEYEPEEVGDDPTHGLWKAHGICMGLAWTVLVPVAIGSSLLRKLVTPSGEGSAVHWFQIHRGLSLLGIILTITGFSLAVRAINKEDGDSAQHFQGNFHEGVGLAVFILALAQAINGLLRPHRLHPHGTNATEEEEEVAHEETNNDIVVTQSVPEQNAEKKNGILQEPGNQSSSVIHPPKTKVRFAWEIFHRVLGITTLALAWTACHTGTEQYDERYDYDADSLVWGLIGGVSGLILVLLVYKVGKHWQ